MAEWWEYKVIEKVKMWQLEDEMSSEGMDGWELVAVRWDDDSALLVFKRPKE